MVYLNNEMVCPVKKKKKQKERLHSLNWKNLQDTLFRCKKQEAEHHILSMGVGIKICISPCLHIYMYNLGKNTYKMLALVCCWRTYNSTSKPGKPFVKI